MKEGVEVQLNPHTVNVFNQNLLEISLGRTRAPEFLHKKVTVTIELDENEDKVGQFVASMRRRFAKRGVAEKDIDDLVKVEKTLRVDEKALRRAIERKEVSLIPHSWDLRIADWSVVPRSIRSTEELEEVEEDDLPNIPKTTL